MIVRQLLRRDKLMPRIVSRLDPRSPQFQDNARALRACTEALKVEIERAAQGGSSAAVRRHRAAGKLTVRERIRVLLDPGAPFLELSQLA
ncbi:propionyl-CoA carboxylase, partial [mine drainage metagenome]